MQEGQGITTPRAEIEYLGKEQAWESSQVRYQRRNVLGSSSRMYTDSEKHPGLIERENSQQIVQNVRHIFGVGLFKT